MIKKTLKFFGFAVGAWLFYVISVLTYGTVTDFQPAAKLPLQLVQKSNTQLYPDSIVKVLSWNIGYAGLGAESNFFYDNAQAFFLSHGKMVRSPEAFVQKNINGVIDFVQKSKADFYLFQEVDFGSKRSYYTDQFKAMAAKKPGFEGHTAINYNVGYVPVPVLEPWNAYGQTLSGLACLSKFKTTAATRYQLPGSFEWPDNVFQLDRCAAVMRIPVQNGKELLVVNIHNSAYDTNGSLKSQQMDFLKAFFLKEYQKGNYVIAGGDWNQCPPGFKYDTFKNLNLKNTEQFNIAADFFPEDWTWAADPTVPTNRRMKDNYIKDETFTTVIDYFLTSPNIESIKVKGINLDFKFSDHQPVLLTARLKGLQPARPQATVQ